MSYYIRIYDNFHHGDESEVFNLANYETYEEALEHAKHIIDDFLEDTFKKEKEPENLYLKWSLFGENPMILTNGKSEFIYFSGIDYAYKRSEEMLRKYNLQKSKK